MEERLVDCGEVKLSCRLWPGEGTPYLLLHGLASNARWWDLVAAGLSPPSPLVAPDLRGHGRSDRPAHGYGFDQVGEDLIRLTATTGLECPIVVGHSWGASVALWLGAHLPGVRGVVCVDGGVVDLKGVFGDDWSVARERMRPPVMEQLDEARVRQFIASSGLAEEAGTEAVAFAMLGNFELSNEGWLHPRLDMERHLEIARALYELRLEELWPRVVCPVLYLLADDSSSLAQRKRIQGAHALEMAGRGGEVRLMKGHHDLPLQHPAAVAAAIASFASKLSSDGATPPSPATP